QAPAAIANPGGQGWTHATWGALGEAAQAIEHILRERGVDRDAPIGWVARNRPAAVAAFAALVMNGRMVVPLRPKLTSATLREDLTTQRLQAVIGDEEDWADEGVVPAAAHAGSLGISIGGVSALKVAL